MIKKNKQNSQHLNGFLFGDLDYSLLCQFSSYAPFKKIYSKLWNAEIMVYNLKVEIRWDLNEKA
jgi:hypothetical protein